MSSRKKTKKPEIRVGMRVRHPEYDHDTAFKVISLHGPEAWCAMVNSTRGCYTFATEDLVLLPELVEIKQYVNVVRYADGKYQQSLDIKAEDITVPDRPAAPAATKDNFDDLPF